MNDFPALEKKIQDELKRLDNLEQNQELLNHQQVGILESVLKVLENCEQVIADLIDSDQIEVDLNLAHSQAYLIKSRESLQEHLHPSK